MKSRSIFQAVSLFLILAFLSACTKTSPTNANTQAPVEPATAETTAPPVETSATAVEPTTAPEPSANLLPPEPQIVTITTEDNFTLTGYYYPAGVENAPAVVLMHWMMGDHNDWNEVAVWLQNRGFKNPFENPGDPAEYRWWDPSWFPTVPAEKSYAVLTFSFRDCKPWSAGCQSEQKANWLKDAKAVMAFARTLEGVDSNRIAAIGSSIGADGAADSCKLLNDDYAGACKGALSLSPGNYLGVSYTDTIQQLGSSSPATPAWCIADPSEFYVCKDAESAGNTAYKDFSIEKGGHGNSLLKPGLDPLPAQLILDFLDEVIQ